MFAISALIVIGSLMYYEARLKQFSEAVAIGALVLCGVAT